MRAQPFEADEAMAEGIKIKWLSTIKDIGEGELTVEVMRLGADGRPQPTGQIETLAADFGGPGARSADRQRVPAQACRASCSRPDGMVTVDAGMMTGRPGVFAGGDMAPGDRTVTAAVGHGKKAARNIDAWLRGLPPPSRRRHPVVAFDQLHLPIYADAPLSVQGRAAVSRRGWRRDLPKSHPA